MARICPNCGFELEELTNFCANCGTPVPPDQTEPVSEPEVNVVPAPVDPMPAEQPPKKKKYLPWLIAGGAVFAVILALAFLWKPVILRVAPHAYLNWAMSTSAKEQNDRQEGSPYELLRSVIADKEKATVSIEADYEPTGADAANIKLSFSADHAAKCWSIDAAATSMGETHDIRMYMDSDCIALGTSLFDDGTNYGLTYESIEEDIRNSVLGDFLTEEQIKQFTEVIDQLDTQMDHDADNQDLLKPYTEMIAEFYNELDPEIGKKKIRIGGENVKCDTITFAMDDKAVMELLYDLLEQFEDDEKIRDTYFAMLNDEEWSEMLSSIRQTLDDMADEMDAELRITYFLRRNKVAAWKATTEFNAEENVEIALMVTYDQDTVSVNIQADAEEEKVELNIVSEVEKDADTYTEELNIFGDLDGTEFSVDLTSNWNRKKGKMSIKLEAESEGESYNGDFAFDFKEIDGGFVLEVDDLYSILCNIDEDFTAENTPFDCSVRLTVSNKCDIRKPKFKNLDQIDEDTLLLFADAMDSISGLLGDSEEDDWAEDDWMDGDDSWDDSGFDFGIIPKVIDEADLLTDDQEENLTYEIESFVWMYEMDMVILTLDTTDGTDILEYIEEYYNWYEYGFGEQSSGVALAYSVEEEAWGIVAFGECSEILSDADLDAILADMEADLIGSDFEQAFTTFVQSSYIAVGEVYWDELLTDEDAALW